MASLPRPSRPSTNPPSAPLPSIPLSKSPRLGDSSSKGSPASSAPPTPSSASFLPQPPSRTVSGSSISTSSSNATSSLASNPPPTNAPSQPLPALPPAKSLRKTTSYNVFPKNAPGSAQRPASSTSTSSTSTATPRSSTVASSLPGAPGRSLSTNLNTRLSSSGGPSPNTPSSLSSKSPLTPQDFAKSDAVPSTDSAVEEDTSRGRPSSRSTKDKGNVIISVRVRPEPAANEPAGSAGEWMVDGRQSLVGYRGREGGDYFYDNVFTAHDKNARVYDSSAKRLVRRVMEGYHGTVFAYGMTGTGKTYSMQGTATSPGVIPLAITDIFSFIRETPQREFLLRVSYLEIYNEKIHDLLSAPIVAPGQPIPQQEEIRLREDSKRGVYATPLKEEIVQSPTQLLRVIARGDHARRTSSTQYNARSSRSHAVVQIVVESRERNAGTPATPGDKRSAIVPGGVRVSTLSLIDLAGSERAAETKERRAEGAHINKSLLTLGTVISRLSGNKDKSGQPTDKEGKHLPYRDSKLTRLLQSALSGNSLISILCTIQIGATGSAAAIGNHTGETLNTLKFAARARNNIVSHAKKAEEAHGSMGDAGSRALLDRYRLEILDLRKQLDSQKEDGQKAKDDEEEKAREQEQEQRHEEQMLEMQLARTALKERIEHLNRLILSSKSIGVNAGRSISSISLPQQRGSIFSQMSFGRSARSSAASTHDGNEKPNRESSTSLTSTHTINQNAQAPESQAEASVDSGDDEEDTVGDNGDGTASLTAQVRNLQEDLSDKNRYIATLEKRLLQARRTSRSRLSASFSNRISSPIAEDEGVESADTALRDKDTEIADLRARLDDKDRMIAALKSAARKRDAADSPRAGSVTGDRSSIISTSTFAAGDNKRASGHSMTSNGTLGIGSKRRSSLNSPTSNLSKVTSASEAPDPSTSPNGRLMQLAGGSPQREVKKTHGVDEMTRMLDEMIRQKVESGGGTAPSPHRHNTSQQSNSNSRASISSSSQLHRGVNGTGDSTAQGLPTSDPAQGSVHGISHHAQNSSASTYPPMGPPRSPSGTNGRPKRGLSAEGGRLSGWDADVQRRRSQRKSGIAHGSNPVSPASASFPISARADPTSHVGSMNSPFSSSGTFLNSYNSPATSNVSPTDPAQQDSSNSPSTTTGSSPTVPALSARLRTDKNEQANSRPTTAHVVGPNLTSSALGRRSGESNRQWGNGTQLHPPPSDAAERDTSPARSDGTAIADEPQENDRPDMPGIQDSAAGLGIENAGIGHRPAPEAVQS